jgi:two-component system NtrC family response regulator
MAMVFLKRAAITYRKPIQGYTAQAVDVLRTYSWPGNVRELSNRIRRAVVMAEGMEITPQDLDLTSEELQAVDSLDSLRVAHRRIEMELLVKAISLHRGNLTRVARDLEVSRSTLYRKLRAFGLEKFVPATTPPSLNPRTKSKKSATLSAQESRRGESPESTPVGTPLDPVHQLS